MIATSKSIRFTVGEYFRLCDAGVFGDRRVELLDGRIVQMHAQSDEHMLGITRTNIILNRYFSDMSKYWLTVQGTYTIEPYDAPEPDFAVYDVPAGTPLKKRPTPALVVEVSKKSYKRDSGIKLRRYAAAGVKDYWILNLNDSVLEVYREPRNPTGRKIDWGYGAVERYDAGGEVEMLAFPHVKVAVSEMLG